ncbi:MAG: hypothetical protein ACTHU0_05495 [Kofleriaceae bacterium]
MVITSGTTWPPLRHPHGSWWGLSNDLKLAKLTLAGLGLAAAVFSALLVWAVTHWA